MVEGESEILKMIKGKVMKMTISMPTSSKFIPSKARGYHVLGFFLQGGQVICEVKPLNCDFLKAHNATESTLS